MPTPDPLPNAQQTAAPTCLNCDGQLSISLVDLGIQPLANSYVPVADAGKPEPKYPLHVRVCERCLLAQVDTLVPPEQIFGQHYAYFSSFSDSWLEHCRQYAAAMTTRFDLSPRSTVVEIASNDGYLLQYFRDAGIPVLGIEPAGDVAAAAEAKGIPTIRKFFGEQTAREVAAKGTRADLLAAKNVLAHVPDINDFVAGIPILLAPDGIFTVEFPHLLKLIQGVQFDTIYHEHFTYLSLLAVEQVFSRHGLIIFDVEELPTHGGSLRVFAAAEGSSRSVSDRVAQVFEAERSQGLDRPEGYASFEAEAQRVRRELLNFLHSCKDEGKTVAAYGAAAKGNTLLNYCGVTNEEIAYVVDRNPAKQDTLLPGSRIPVLDPAVLQQKTPDYLLILPWNIRQEVVAQNASLRAAGTQFVTAIPRLEIF